MQVVQCKRCGHNWAAVYEPNLACRSCGHTDSVFPISVKHEKCECGASIDDGMLEYGMCFDCFRVSQERVKDPREHILDKARMAIMSDRNKEYGPPEDNFADIASMWTTFKGVEFSALDVAYMMILMKAARAMTSPTKEDHMVDIAGYAACAARCV